MMKKMLFLVYIIFLEIILIASTMAKFDEVMSPTKLKMFVDELPDMPRIKSYDIINGVHVPKSFNIGMYHKKWVSKLFITTPLIYFVKL